MISLTYWQFIGALSVFLVVWGVMLKAAHDYHVINKSQDWHKWSFIRRVVTVLMIGLMWIAHPDVIWLNEFWEGTFILVALWYSGSLLWLLFDPLLNKLRGLPVDHKGNNPLDQVAIEYKLIALGMGVAFVLAWFFFGTSQF